MDLALLRPLGRRALLRPLRGAYCGLSIAETFEEETISETFEEGELVDLALLRPLRRVLRPLKHIPETLKGSLWTS